MKLNAFTQILLLIVSIPLVIFLLVCIVCASPFLCCVWIVSIISEHKIKSRKLEMKFEILNKPKSIFQ